MTGPARLFAILAGSIYLGLAILLSVLGFIGRDVTVNNNLLIMYGFGLSALYWGTAIGLFAGLYYGRWPARIMSAVVGGVFALAAFLGFMLTDTFARLAGLPEVAWASMTLNVLHAATAVLGIAAAIVSHARPSMMRNARAV